MVWENLVYLDSVRELPLGCTYGKYESKSSLESKANSLQ